MVFGLSVVDLFVIAGYFAIVLGIGAWSMRRIRNQEDYFLAGRRFGKFVQVFIAFGQGTNVESPVGTATTTFTNGAAGIWSSLIYLPVTPFYWLITPWMRRLRLLTMGDYYEERYGSKGIAGLYTLVACLVMMAHLSVGFAAASITLLAMTPKAPEQLSVSERAEYALAEEHHRLRTTGYEALTDHEKARLAELNELSPRRVFSHLDRNLVIWIVCIVVMLYAMAGGFEAAALTDTLQGMCIILLSFLLLPFTFMRINQLYGGEGIMDALRTVHARVPESFFDIFGSPTMMDFTWYYILALAMLAISNTPAQAAFLTTNASARNEYAARFGATWGSYIKRFLAVVWGFFALCAIVIYHDRIAEPDLLWGYATHDLLGPVGLGLVGLMIASLMAALMSTADAIMITSSSLLTHNVYRPLLPGCAERHYVRVGRVLGAGVVILGALVATRFDTILQLLKFMWELNVMIAAPFWLGMKWRRANRKAAWTTMVFAAVVFFAAPALLPELAPGLRRHPRLLGTTEPIVVARTYRAHSMDVEKRAAERARWAALSAEEQAATPQPPPLALGERFDKETVLPAKSIFWTKGIKRDEAGRPYGSGMLSLELVALEALGVDLSRHAYAGNETLRVLIRVLVPFLLMIGVSLLTRPDDAARLDRFYVKMKTVVVEDRQEDARNLQLSYANPRRFDDRKLFPRSNWEFDKWDRVDAVGFGLAVLCIFAVLGLLKFLISLGG